MFVYILGIVTGWGLSYYRREIRDFYTSVWSAFRDFGHAVRKQLLTLLGGEEQRSAANKPTAAQPTHSQPRQSSKKTESLL